MLSLAGRLYGKIADLRNALYDKGVLRSHSLGVKTISVGNVTAGGTGKTPLVAHIAETLLERGYKVCILTRGYGRNDPSSRVLVADGSSVLADAKTAGDEPAELALKLKGKAVIIADPDRVSSGVWAKEKFGVTVFILDDGFQHRKVERDLDIVCIDATDPLGNEKMLPAGSLREPLHNLARADVVVLTRANLVDDVDALSARIRTYNSRCLILRAENRIAAVQDLEGFLKGDDTRGDGPPQPTVAGCMAFCGIGNPENFFAMLHDSELSIRSKKAFPDHHAFSQSDIENLEREAAKSGARVLLTTAKDAVKLGGLRLSMPYYVVLSELKISDEAELDRLVLSFGWESS